MQKIAILILAAGSSTRMKTAKQLLPYKDTTLLGWTIKTAKETTVNNIVCVLGANEKVIKKSIEEYKIETVYNPNFSKGISSSIVIGIQYFLPKHFDSVLIVLADQPKITSTYLNKLLKTFEKNPTKIIATNYDKNIGVPAIFSNNYFADLLQLSGDKGAQKLLQKMQSEVIILNSMNLVDIDTKEDYDKLIT